MVPIKLNHGTKSDEDEPERICRYCLDGKNSIDLISPCDCEGHQNMCMRIVYINGSEQNMHLH